MKNLGLFVAIFFLSASGQAQKEDDAEGIVLYEYKFPIPMVYVHKEAKVFVALDGHGKKTMYEFKCEADSELFDFKYFSKEYLEEMNCDSYLNSESK